MTNTNSNFRLIYLCVLLLFISGTFQAEVKWKVTQSTDIEEFGDGRKSVGARHLVSTNIASEQGNNPSSKVQTVKQQNTKNTSSFNINSTTWSALESSGMPVQENSTIMRKEAKDSLIVHEISQTEGSELEDPVQTPIAHLNRGRSTTTRSSPAQRAGSDTDDDDDSGLSRTAIIAIVASIVGVFVLALIICLIQYCNQPYFRNQRRIKKASQKSSELKVVTTQDDVSPQVESSL